MGLVVLAVAAVALIDVNRRPHTEVVADSAALATNAVVPDEPGDNEAATAPETPPTHLWDVHENGQYGYSVGISQDEQNAGQVVSRVIMFRYLGFRNGVYTLISTDGGFFEATCANPCQVITLTSGYQVIHITYNPVSTIGEAFTDAMNGQLEAPAMEDVPPRPCCMPSPIVSAQPERAPPAQVATTSSASDEAAKPASDSGESQTEAGDCWRYDSGWRQLPGQFGLTSCVEVLYAGRCQRRNEALYGRWGDETLRLTDGRIEVSSDNRSFHSLIDPWQGCRLTAKAGGP